LQASNTLHLVANTDPDIRFSGTVYSNLELFFR